MRTYNPRSHTDPVELLDEYFQVLDYTTSHPEQSSKTIARTLDLPHRRIERWINYDDPVVPNCIRGLEIAEERGWIAIDIDSEIFQGMNILVAFSFSSGTIVPQSWNPSFSIPNSNSLQRMIMAMKWIDAEYELERKTRRLTVSELHVTTAPSVLGRVLYALGAPLENTHSESIQLPAYIDEVNTEHREAFVKTFLNNQEIASDSRDILAVDTSVNGFFLDQLRELVEEVSGTEIACDGKRLVIPEHSAKSLGLG